jgi:hypothetical protein
MSDIHGCADLLQKMFPHGFTRTPATVNVIPKFPFRQL